MKKRSHLLHKQQPTKKRNPCLIYSLFFYLLSNIPLLNLPNIQQLSFNLPLNKDKQIFVLPFYRSTLLFFYPSIVVPTCFSTRLLFYHSNVLTFYCSTTLLFYPSFVPPIYCSTLRLFYSSFVLSFYCSTPLLFNCPTASHINILPIVLTPLDPASTYIPELNLNKELA